MWCVLRWSNQPPCLSHQHWSPSPNGAHLSLPAAVDPSRWMIVTGKITVISLVRLYCGMYPNIKVTFFLASLIPFTDKLHAGLFFYLTSKECPFLYITPLFLVSTFKPNLSLRRCCKFPLCVRLQILVLSFRSWCIESQTSAASTGSQNTTSSQSIQGRY